MAAAVLLATLNSPGSMTAPFILVASVGLPLMLLPTARLIDQRSEAAKALVGVLNTTCKLHLPVISVERLPTTWDKEWFCRPKHRPV